MENKRMESKRKRKKKLCRWIAAALLCGSVTAAFPQPAVWAAAQQTATAKVTAETESPVSFKERVKRIVDEYNAKNDAKTKPYKAYNGMEKKTDAASGKKEPEARRQDPPRRPPSQKTYSFDWQGTPLTQTLYSLSKLSGKRVVINGSLSGNVYTYLQGVTYEQALNYLSKSFNFNWMLDEDGGAILISPGDVMVQTKRFVVHYANKAKVKDELLSLGFEDKNVYANDEYGSVSVTGTPYQIYLAEKRIHEMDKPVEQCLIVAQLIEVTHGKDVDLGLKYELPTYTHAQDDNLKGNFIEKLTFSASSAAEKSLSKGKVVARPMTMTLNGQTADLYMGDSVPVLTSTSTSASTDITVEYKDVGSKLKVTPYIDKTSGEVSLNVELEISNIMQWITQGNVSAPQIASRKTTTSAHLQSGQSFVIGGLMTARELDNLSGIPGLMDLPILGKLFSYHTTSKTNTEVFIMLTPYIVASDLDPETILRKAGETDRA